MKATKVFFLFLALVLPVGIFVFLKLFGRNEFDVPALYVTEAPPQLAGCTAAKQPYNVPDSIRMAYLHPGDSLAVIFFQPLSGEALNQLDRVREQTANDPVRLTQADSTNTQVDSAHTQTDSTHTSAQFDPARIRRCAFFMEGDVNVVMIDGRGVIRGQYKAAEREEIDRLLTEITILLKKY
jgi:hypothetical protein